MRIQPKPTGHGSSEEPDKWGTQGLMLSAAIICTRPPKWTSKYSAWAPLAEAISLRQLVMQQKRSRASVKLGFKKAQFENPEMSAPIIKRNRLVDILKAEGGTVGEARVSRLKKRREYSRVTGRIHGVRIGFVRTAVKVSREKWFGNADHDEIKQLNGESASTFTYGKPEFGCPLRS